MQHDSASTRDRNEISERRHELYVDTIDKVLIILGGGVRKILRNVSGGFQKYRFGSNRVANQ
jgi:hypothetical protein